MIRLVPILVVLLGVAGCGESRPTRGAPVTPTRASSGDPAASPAATRPARVVATHSRPGRAAYDFLTTATDLALEGRIDGITTLPLNKEALRAGGSRHPGHTEILAERCGVTDHAMMLYLGPPIGATDVGLGVLHATLHVPRRCVFAPLTVP